MNALQEALSAGARSFDWEVVHKLCERYVRGLRRSDSLTGAEEWRPILHLLRENRRYDDMILVADAVMAAGIVEPLLQRAVAQTLVDRGTPMTARSMFQQLAREAGDGASTIDLAEAEGGVARCAKDLFVMTTAAQRRRRFLQEAYACYRRAYERRPNDNYWHGINAAALAARAGRDGVALEGVADAWTEATRLAESVYMSVTQVSHPDSWHQATACEACVALDSYDEAIEHGRLLVDDPTVTAFEVNALLRQFTQVWQLDVLTDPGTDLLPLLRAGLLARTGGDVLLSPHELSHERVDPSAQSSRFEKVFGADRYVSLPWYREGLLRCRAVCRIDNQFNNPVGTGFVVAAGDLGLADQGHVVLTNAHVVPKGVEPAEARVVFEALDGENVQRQFRVTELIWTSPVTDLDSSVLRLEGEPHQVSPVPVTKTLARIDGDTPHRAYVIGHPSGWTNPQFSLHDNRLLDFDETYLHYRSPTEPGSSGSPVFDDEWKLIGLHHAGGSAMPRLGGKGGVYQANAAIRITAICSRVASATKPAAGTPPP